jgi:hypothetical protein
MSLRNRACRGRYWAPTVKLLWLVRLHSFQRLQPPLPRHTPRTCRVSSQNPELSSRERLRFLLDCGLLLRSYLYFITSYAVPRRKP